jgi:hypothetical protein
VASANYLLETLTQSRTRSSWNDRLTHWEKPASDTEEAQIERAASMVRNALSSSQWLAAEGVIVAPQGSYFNNTNVRQTADQDLRAVHPDIRVEHSADLTWQTAVGYLGTSDTGRTFPSVVAQMRAEIDHALAQKFGVLSLDTSGTKATRVLALPSSRAPVDVVPCFRYVWVSPNGLGGIAHSEGVAILSKDGTSWTNNFPAQHNANGIAKRARTQHRFKNVVRSLKRIRDELVSMGVLGDKQAPSFFIECLTYAVEDYYFTATDPEQRYDRLVQIVGRMSALVHDPQWTSAATEINEIKYLFHVSQPWMVADAQWFVSAVRARLLNA